MSLVSQLVSLVGLEDVNTSASSEAPVEWPLQIDHNLSQREGIVGKDTTAGAWRSISGASEAQLDWEVQLRLAVT